MNVISIYQKQFNLIPNFNFKFGNFLITCIICNIIATYYVYNFIVKKGLSLIATLDRISLTKALNESSFWAVKYILIGFTCFLVFLAIMKKIKDLSVLKRRLLYFVNVPVILFWIVNIIIGNRRELIYLFFFLIVLIVIYKNIQVWKINLSVVIVFVFVLFAGFLRSIITENKVDTQFFFLTGFGEFLFPYQTLLYYVSLDEFSYRLGSTYLYVFYFFVPRIFIPFKRHTLGAEFSADIHSLQGFAFTPLTEAYMNFGYLSFIFLPLILFFIFKLFSKANHKLPFISIFLILGLPNLSRGEIPNLFIETFFLYTPFILLYKFAFKKHTL